MAPSKTRHISNGYDLDISSSGTRKPQDKDRVRKSSQKMVEIEKDKENAQRKKMERLLAENTRMKKKLKASGNAKDTEVDGEENDVESEEESSPVFSNSVKSLGVLPGSPPKALRRLKAPKVGPMKTVLSSVTNGPLTVDEGGTPTQFIENHSREGSANGSVNRSRQPSEFHQDGGVSAVHSSLEGSATRSVNHSRQPSEFPQDDGLPIKSSYEPERSANRSVVREVSEARTDIHSRGRSLHRSSTNRVPSQTASSSPSNSRSRSVSESRKHLKNAPFFNDVIPTGRPAIKDYSPPIRRRLLDTVFIYENWILSNDGFPDKEVQYSWARESWEICNRNTSEQFKLSERMVKLITARGSRIRGHLKDIIRPLIPAQFKFSSSTSRGSVLANVERHLFLMEDKKFHYKDVDSCKGYASNDIIDAALRSILFENGNKSRGIVLASCFSPLQLPSIALVLTIVEFCIEEWSTGHYLKRSSFEEADNLARYTAHLQKLVEWRSLNTSVVDNILRKRYDRMRKSSGVLIIKDISTKMTDSAKDAAMKELEGRTGDTDSEMEDD